MGAEKAARCPSIGRGVWRSFMLFTVVILCVLWLMQTVFLGAYYESAKTRQILDAARKMAAALGSGDAMNRLTDMALDNNLSFVLSHANGMVSFSSDDTGRGNLFRAYGAAERIDACLVKAAEGALTEQTHILPLPRSDMEVLLVAEPVRLAGTPGVLFVGGVLQPIRATADILKNQLAVITVLLLILSAFIATLLSGRISKPLVRLTGAAKKLAAGDYTPNFEGGVFSELTDLADSLNSAATELGRAEALRRELVANVSHDLRTPLTMIKAYAEMLRDITGGDPDKRRAQLGVIIDEADRLGRLVSDLVALSREQAPGMAPNRARYDLAPDLERLCDRFRASFPGHRFTLTADAACAVYADRDRINQALYNLVSNAVRYTGDNRGVCIRQTLSENAVRVEVLDAGPGIPENELPLIWRRYYRGSAHTAETAGTGLGLAIVKEVADAHGARCGAENRPEGGSLFWIEIPTA